MRAVLHTIASLNCVALAGAADPFDYHQPFYILLACIGFVFVLGLLSFFLPPLQRRENERPAQFWKFGIFYVNPDDPATFVPKRFGIGYTLNFGRPFSWLVLALIFIAALAPLAFALHSLRLRSPRNSLSRGPHIGIYSSPERYDKQTYAQ